MNVIVDFILTLPVQRLKECSLALKLVRTPLNVLLHGFKIIFLSLYAPIYLGWTLCLISFAWDQEHQERVESDKIQNEKFLPTVGFEPTTLRLEVWCSTDWASRACGMLSI